MDVDTDTDRRGTGFFGHPRALGTLFGRDAADPHAHEGGALNRSAVDAGEGEELRAGPGVVAQQPVQRGGDGA